MSIEEQTLEWLQTYFVPSSSKFGQGTFEASKQVFLMMLPKLQAHRLPFHVYVDDSQLINFETHETNQAFSACCEANIDPGTLCKVPTVQPCTPTT